jgi:hypothetical protein
MKSRMADTLVAVSMFVYMDLASVENKSAPSGIFNCFISFITVDEFGMYDCTSGSRSFILKSIQLERMERKLLEVLMTAQS